MAVEPYLRGAIVITDEYLSYFTRGESHKPDFSMHFPARRITTRLSWDDLVLTDDTMDEIEDIRDWLQYGEALMNEWDMRKKIKPGVQITFTGRRAPEKH